MVMESEYYVSGMTCGSCVAKVKEKLQALRDVSEVHVQLESPQVTLTSHQVLDLDRVNDVLAQAGHYTISNEQIQTELAPMPSIKKAQDSIPLEEKKFSWGTYKPLFLIVGFVAGVSGLVQFPFVDFNWMLWMRYFMAGFFIVFSFFKLLNLSGFAHSYQMYDIIAARWKGWGYAYPFVELGLGVLYLINLFPVATNIATAVILGVSSVGVIESNLNNRKIKCACLGDVFNLPMSTVTIIEDLTMVAMALLMLLWI